ncbi:TetR/AcrR family transcriptional regulator [Conexibacter sp. CPCC 206217]|uniref:TetR/AcrR family transcriptional regulator n=1 Tax=Conexibacter sp. CPCC 206217 TaxID=3064574 RepID=UPI0027237736|nr:TetR/AcrR family transcriptional regulator [Conexibacter sp. CPCC 206217]MDO8209613.1 TetR/AcrR family transcriptional regulator [Conexibacter sp. CPCC 206217]
MARPRTFDEADVVVTARELFWQRGFDGASMSDLCEATGVASQSLYRVFGSKHGLFVRTLEDYCDRQLAGLARAQGADRPPWEWLMAAVTFEDGGRVDLGPDGCFLSSSSTARSRIDADVRAAAQRTYERIRELFAVMLERARAAGDVRADIDVDDAAMALLTAMQGIEFLRKSGIQEERFEQAKRSTVAMLTAAYAGATA